MKEAQKRDFINLMLQLVDEEKSNLETAGFMSDAKRAALDEKKKACDVAEMAQQQAAAKAKEATAAANLSLDEAYREASNLADAISGILGKESEIVKKMRKFRN